MDDQILKDIKKQHIDNYKKSLLEIVTNNTIALVDDIKSFLVKPPLDSMDVIRSKMISVAKKNKIVLDTEELDNVLISYRTDVLKCCDKIMKMRIDSFSKIINDYDFKSLDSIIFYKKNFVELNKQMKKILKEQINSSIENKILGKISKLISSSNNEVIDSFNLDLSKYLKKQYQKQLLESFDIKLLVKDTTLINSIKEQGDHYLFTLKNSRLLNDFD